MHQKGEVAAAGARNFQFVTDDNSQVADVAAAIDFATADYCRAPVALDAVEEGQSIKIGI